MAEALSVQTPSLSEQYHLEKEVKPVEVKATTQAAATEATTAQSDDASPVKEAVSAVVETEVTPGEDAPSADEDKSSEEEEEEVVEETPDEIKLETAPADFRFPTTNQTRHCFTRYIEYHRCVAAKGEEAPECDKFAKFYRSLCPSEWVDRWNEQRENGTFPGPL
ncbi:unnamed protein product [Cochlearia groenlandica]